MPRISQLTEVKTCGWQCIVNFSRVESIEPALLNTSETDSLGQPRTIFIQGLLETKDTHRPRTLQLVYAQEYKTFLAAVPVLNFE